MIQCEKTKKVKENSFKMFENKTKKEEADTRHNSVPNLIL
jgi:hypothetical protein